VSSFSVHSSPKGTWWWREYDLSKRRQIHTEWRNVTSQNNWIFSNPAVRSSNEISVEDADTQLPAGRSRIRIQTGTKKCSFLHNRPHRLWGPPSFLFHPGVNWPGCDVGHSPLTNTRVWERSELLLYPAHTLHEVNRVELIMDKTPTHALFTQHYISLACWFH